MASKQSAASCDSAVFFEGVANPFLFMSDGGTDSTVAGARKVQQRRLQRNQNSSSWTAQVFRG